MVTHLANIVMRKRVNDFEILLKGFHLIARQVERLDGNHIVGVVRGMALVNRTLPAFSKFNIGYEASNQRSLP